MATAHTPKRPEFATRLKESRTAAKLSQERAANGVGTSRRHWIRWENGETTPNPRYLTRIAEVLGDESLLEFLDDDDDEESQAMAAMACIDLNAILMEAVRRAVREVVSA